MDARITKSRLSNLLSYDWIKILVAIVVAVLGLVAFFTTIKTRPGRIHTFTVYGYAGIYSGTFANQAERDLLEGVLSYDILKADFESFGEDEYSDVAYAARRSSGTGNVMFTTTNPGEGGESVLQNVAGGELTEIALDVEQYLSDCEQYLIRFFGENWRTAEVDVAEAKQCFLKRNGKDNRYRFSAEKREQGVKDECARLEKLREDYLAVLESFQDGTLEYSEVKDESGNLRKNGISLKNLAGVNRLFYYYEEESKAVSTANLCMILFRNDNDAGVAASKVENDLRYECISFIRYLVGKFSV